MYENIYCDIREINKMILSSLRNHILYTSREAKPEELLGVSFIEESKMCYYTALRFPSKIANDKEKRVQKQNYDYFIQTMADMIKKYI